ncbi:MAG: extracellular solute-binding protein [Ruminococcaceae bacterium]|nr:extracellular solute-binding protein [Oscillospiraceae bacterium]
MKSIKKIALLLLTLSVITMSFAGCGGSDKGSSFSGEISFPLTETAKLTYWVPLSGSVGVVDNFNQMGMYKTLQEKTNVEIEFIHPVQSNVKEQFNIMIATGEYPDIIEGMSNYPGGVTKAYDDGVVVRLNELSDYTPNLNKIYEEYPFLTPYIKEEDGSFLIFPVLRGGAVLRQGNGPIFRKDWLKDVGASAPETISDWTDILRKFKTEKKASRPLILTTSDLKKDVLIGAYGIKYGFFADNNQIKYGPYDARYKDYLTLLNSWYTEGLLDKEFTTLNSKTVDSSVLNGEGGAYIGVLGNGLQRYLTLATAEGFDLQPVQYPVLKKGDKQTIETLSPIVGTKNCSISTTCKNPELAAAWLDYAYGEEGHYIYNFGVEGESFEFKDGEPVYTELLTNNPEGKAFSTVGRSYARSFGSGPFVLDTRYGNQFFSMPVQQEAVSIWGKFSKEAEEAGHEFIGILTSDENKQATLKMNSIQTYVDESFVQFVMGTKPLSEFDGYIAQLKKMGIEDVIKIYQGSQDRFIKNNPEYKIPYDTDISNLFSKK